MSYGPGPDGERTIVLATLRRVWEKVTSRMQHIRSAAPLNNARRARIFEDNTIIQLIDAMIREEEGK